MRLCKVYVLACTVDHTFARQIQQSQYIAKTVYRKFEKNISRSEIARPHSHSCIHASVSDLYFPRSLRNMNVAIGTEAGQLLFWEYINWIFFALYYMYAFMPSSDDSSTNEVPGA
jgi:hypothetical protein